MLHLNRDSTYYLFHESIGHLVILVLDFEQMNFSTYSADIDNISRNDWSELLPLFSDANLPQTWPSGGVTGGEKSLSHLILKGNEGIAAMAQVNIKKLLGIRAGVATVYWGPMWRRKGRAADYAVLDKVIEALKKEYVTKRGFLLRIWPIGFENSEEGTKSILEKHGFTRNSRVQPYRTLLLDLSPSLEELRRNLAQKWRNQLNVAEKSNLRLLEGSSDEMYLTFLKMLDEMVSRKKFETQVDYGQYRRIQNNLPEHLKMKNFVCNCEGEAVAAGVFTAIGETGTYLLGATANKGLRVNGSNLIQWGVIKWLKGRGCQWYDLGGIDPSGNPGVYHFKSGLAGKSGKEVTHLGQFYLANNPISYYLNICIDRVNYARTKLHKGLKLFSRKGT